MGSFNLLTNYCNTNTEHSNSGSLFSQSRAYPLLEQLLGMQQQHHYHHHHHLYHAKPDQPVDLQLGLGSLNLGHKRVSEIRSTTTLLTPNRLLVQTVVDLNHHPLTHHQHQPQPQPQHQYPFNQMNQMNHNIMNNHFLFRQQCTGWPLNVQKSTYVVPVQNYNKVEVEVDEEGDEVRMMDARGGGRRPIILGLFPENNNEICDDGRLHSLVTGVNGVYECPTCRIEFYSRYCYAAHVKIHHDNETRQERRLRLHNKYMSKMARRRRRLLRTWTHAPMPRRTTPAAPAPAPAPAPTVSVKLEPQ